MKNKRIYYFDEPPEMIDAYHKARKTFKYFWREVWWDYHRIIPGLDMAYVKVKFSQENGSEPPITEHMWIDEIDFDGFLVKGYLINTPDKLTNIQEGDYVEIPVGEISDWLFTIHQKAYGGFTIQAMRAGMTKRERKKHDKLWGVDFGDPDNIQVVYEQDKHPENLTEHPMCKNIESLKEYLTQNPEIITNKDEAGYTMLQKEAIAGNKACVELLLQMGADKNVKTNDGYTAYDFAKQMEWEHLIPVLLPPE